MDLDVDEDEDELSLVPSEVSSSAGCISPGSSAINDVGKGSLIVEENGELCMINLRRD